MLLLQGYLFFGSANRLYSRVREELRRGETGDRRFLILDFGLVSGIDSSAIVSFTKIARAAAAAAADLLLTGLSPGVEKALRGAGLLDGAASRIRTFADVDRAMEWCEGETLETGRSSRDARLVTREWHEWLADELGNAALADLLATYLEKVDRPSGEHVCHQGEPSDAIYFVESGRISILLEREGGAPVRLRTMTGRTVIGEIGFYLGEPRSASVVADDPSIIHSLTPPSRAAGSSRSGALPGWRRTGARNRNGGTGRCTRWQPEAMPGRRCRTIPWKRAMPPRSRLTAGSS